MPISKGVIIAIVAVVVLCSISSIAIAMYLPTKIDYRYCWPGDTYNTAACPNACANKANKCNGGMAVKDGKSCKWNGGENWDCGTTKAIPNFDSSKTFISPSFIRW